MFQYQIDSMHETMAKLISRHRPPDKVLIKHEHAVYLDVRFVSHTVPMYKRRQSGLITGQVTECVVKVRLLDLYNALQEAVGVEYKPRKKASLNPAGVERFDFADQTHGGDDSRSET